MRRTTYLLTWLTAKQAQPQLVALSRHDVRRAYWIRSKPVAKSPAPAATDKIVLTTCVWSGVGRGAPSPMWLQTCRERLCRQDWCRNLRAGI